jgi:ribA/ribD-fused uncharacterized protein
MISEFQDKYRFLSNFWPCSIKFSECLPEPFDIFPSSEHVFQAMKCDNNAERISIRNAETAGKAKRLGRKIKMRNDWDQIKNDVMFAVLKAKFDQHPDLAELLLSTGEEELVEGNDWGDTYWGVCNGEGHNHLGKMLMKIRYILKVRKEKE